MNLDEYDLKIIELLKEDARLTISDISRLLNLSRQTVRSRIRKLEKDKIIQKYTIKISSSIFDRGIVFIIAETENPEKFSEIEEIEEVYRISNRKFIIKSNIDDFSRLNEISRLEWLEVVEIIPVLEFKEFERPLTLRIKFKCDYCGKEVDDKPLIYKHHNKMYVLCCKTCLDEFKKI
jgi:DNA-binding Lrp family transcriptional regulator